MRAASLRKGRGKASVRGGWGCAEKYAARWNRESRRPLLSCCQLGTHTTGNFGANLEVSLIPHSPLYSPDREPLPPSLIHSAKVP